MSEVVDEDFKRSLELLPQVFDLLLDRVDNEIKDDTCLEKIMSWFEESLKDRVKLCLILKSRTWHCLQAFSDCDGERYSGICLTLKLISCLAKSINRFIQEDDIVEVTRMNLACMPYLKFLCIKQREEAGKEMSHMWNIFDGSAPPNESVAENKDDVVVIKRGHELLADLLQIGEHHMASVYPQDSRTMLYCWILTATELVDITDWIPVLKNKGLVLSACELLNDESMFVVHAAETFLAKVLLISSITRECQYLRGLPDEESGGSCGLDRAGVSSKTSPASPTFSDDERSCTKRTINECSPNDTAGPSKLLRMAKAEAKREKAEATLVQWADEIFDAMALDTLVWSSGVELCGVCDAEIVDLKIIGVMSCLLRMYPVVATYWFERQDITRTYCNLFGKSSISVFETDAIAELICLQMNNLRRLSTTDESHNLIQSVFGIVTSLMKDRTRWRSAFQMMPPLFGLCSRIHIKKRSVENAKRLAVQLTSDLLSSVRDPSDTQTHSGFTFGGNSKQDLISVRRCVMIFIADIIRENSWSLVEELTSQALKSIECVLQFIPSQYRLCSKSLVDRLSMQTLDALDALLKKVPESDRNHLPPIIHQQLELINSADCNNTVLEKGLKVLKTFLSLDGDRNIRLMQKAKDVLEKHLMSIHWEARDSAVQFIGTLTENPNDLVSGWLLGTKLHHDILDKLEDEESYVRQGALNALSILIRNQTLLNDLMEKKNLNKLDIARKVTRVVLKDSGGFARRAAMTLLCSWIQSDGEIRSSVLYPQKWKKDAKSTSVDQCSTLAEVILLAVTTATRDFDWEVKLSALAFWAEFYMAIVPGLKLTLGSKTDDKKVTDASVLTDVIIKDESVHTMKGVQEAVDPQGPSTSGTQNGPLNDSSSIPAYAALLYTGNVFGKHNSEGNKESCCRSNSKDTVVVEDATSWTEMLQDHTFFNLLIEKLSDEDRTVCERACEILIGIQNHLKKLCEYNSARDSSRESKGTFCDIPSSEVDKLKEELKQLEGYKIDDTYKGCLEGFSEKMAPLLEEILCAAAKESTPNQNIDCY